MGGNVLSDVITSTRDPTPHASASRVFIKKPFPPPQGHKDILHFKNQLDSSTILTELLNPSDVNLANTAKSGKLILFLQTLPTLLVLLNK